MAITASRRRIMNLEMFPRPLHGRPERVVRTVTLAFSHGCMRFWFPPILIFMMNYLQYILFKLEIKSYTIAGAVLFCFEKDQTAGTIVSCNEMRYNKAGLLK
jgi:hypothetical protein